MFKLFVVVVIYMNDLEQMIEKTKKYNKVKLSFEGSVNNVIRSCGEDSWGIREACRLYKEGREAWLRGDLETVSELFGILV